MRGRDEIDRLISNLELATMRYCEYTAKPMEVRMEELDEFTRKVAKAKVELKEYIYRD
jgi:hypothetical protein